MIWFYPKMINIISFFSRKSEDYEAMCPQKLDMLINKAQSIEDNLNTRKDALSSRLKGISKTLEM